MLKIFKEGVCPKCHEKIQVPDDREQIICMYCGQKIRTDLALGVERETDAAVLEEKKEQVQKGLSLLIQECDKPFQDFKKDKYPGMIENFSKKHQEMFQAMEYIVGYSEKFQ